MIPNLLVLGSLVRDIHQSLSHLFYVMLPVLIVMSVIGSYLKSGELSFPEALKRALVAALLLASFPEVSTIILDICDGVAAKIDDMSGLETFMRMASEKLHSYATARNVLLLQFDDIFMAILSFASFIILYIARYLTIALYYFYWTLLSICSPLMILCYVFPSLSGITRNLYRGLIEVACWKILWAIQSAMLASLSFGNIYQTEGSYLTLIILNFVIAIGLLCTPMLMRSLIGDGVQGSAQIIGAAAVSAAIALPAKSMLVHKISREMLTDMKKYAGQKIQSFRPNFNKSPQPGRGGDHDANKNT